jgi:hypothetical protein
MTTWLTRTEAARHLRMSVRQLTRLGLPHAMNGRCPRYELETLDDYYRQRMIQGPDRTKGGPRRPPHMPPSRQRLADAKAFVRSWR